MKRREIVLWVCVLSASAIAVFLYARLEKANMSVERLADVCKHVREQLCLTRESIDLHRDRVLVPSEVEIGACAPGVWRDWELDEAVKKGTYEAELRAQAEAVIATIPTAYDAAHDPCLVKRHR
jgi:hypothetical protein